VMSTASLAASGLGPMSSLFDGRRPSKIDRPPTGAEIKKLRERLAKCGAEGEGLTPAAREFLAGAVTSPAAVRQQLSRPTIRPTATGYLEVIHATVPLDCLAPDPTNGRVVGATSWPASDLDEGQTMKLWGPADMAVHPDSPCEVLIRCESLREIKTLIEDAAEHTKKLNPQMQGKIQRDGILDPLLCQLVHIETRDGQHGIALVTRDGSTRCAYALEAHRMSVHDAFFGAVRDVEHRRGRWLEMRRRTERPIESISEEEMIELRTFLVDVQIVIGFHTEDSQVTALSAVDDIVRRTHVEVTHPWRAIAQRNSEADKVLGALQLDEGLGLFRNELLLFGGKLPRSQRAERGLPVEPDEVVAALLHRFGATENRRGVLDDLHARIRAVDGRSQVRSRYKAEIVAALGLRQFTVEAALRDTAHLTLGAILGLESIWDQPWENTGRSPEDLCEAALTELAQEDEPGCVCRELLVKAAGHLAARGWLKGESRNAYGGFRDQREPESVLDLMHSSPQGIKVLAEVLTAGRRGETARALGEGGEAIELVAGDLQPADNQWIRKTFIDDADRDRADEFAVRPPVNGTTPRERVASLMRSLDISARNMERTIEDAERIADDNGSRFLQRYGWAQSEMAPLAQRLNEIGEKLRRFGVISEINPDLPPQMALVPEDEEQAA
jgi:hypothetical protein